MDGALLKYTKALGAMSNGYYHSGTGSTQNYHWDEGLCYLRSVEDAGTDYKTGEWTRVYRHRPPRLSLRSSYSYDYGEVEPGNDSWSGGLVP